MLEQMKCKIVLGTDGCIIQPTLKRQEQQTQGIVTGKEQNHKGQNTRQRPKQQRYKKAG